MTFFSRLSRYAGAIAISLIAQIASAQIMTCNTPLTAAQRGYVKFVPGHYVALGTSTDVAEWFSDTLDEISAPALDNKIIGVQKRYFWADLNPSLGTYRWTKLRADIAEAKSVGKRLSVMIMFKFRNDYDETVVPDHIKDLDGREYSGAYQKPWYKINGDGNKPNSEVANFGHRQVRDRFIIFLNELAEVIDGEDTVTSVVLPESAMGIKAGKEPYDDLTEAEFAPVRAAHAEGLRAIDQVAGCIFKHTPVIPLTNYPPDALDEFFDTFEKFKLGLGGPDIWTNDEAIGASYRHVRRLNTKLPVGFIVASGNYQYVSRKGEEAHMKDPDSAYTWTHKYRNGWTTEETPRRTIQSLLTKAHGLGANYLFWKKNGETGDKYWDAFKSEVAAGRISNLDSSCPTFYSSSSPFSKGCVRNLP